MNRVRSVLAVVMVLSLAYAAAAQAQDRPRRRRSRRGRSTLLGLLSVEKVQKELKLTEEQLAKVKEVSEKLGAEMRKEYAALREIEDRQKRIEKMAELRTQFDRKAREQLGEVIPREQMRRLYQIRMQVRSVLDSLGNRYVAGRLKITDEQKTKLAEITKEMQTKRTELFSSARDASREERTKMFEKFRKLRADTDKKALALLTDEQKKIFDAMKGEKFEFDPPPGATPPAEKTTKES